MDNYDELKKKAKNSENYKKWHRIHAQPFGEIYEKAFLENDEAQITLTSALTDISERNFSKGLTKLNTLLPLCLTELDTASINYFIGLCYELMGDTDKMEKSYKRLLATSVKPEVILQFSPYYRTGKMAQGVAECDTAIYYYTKAMELYDNRSLSKQSREKASQIVYDMATVLLFSHKYEDALYFLDLSEKYCGDKNESRDYVRAVLYALLGKLKASNDLKDGLSPYLKLNCTTITKNIINKCDLHYFAVPQIRKGYNSFWSSMEENKEGIMAIIGVGKIDEAEKIISEALTKLFPFAKRRVECRLFFESDRIIAKFKNYFIKTLEAEENALIELKGDRMDGWEFVSVSEFFTKY